MRRKQTMPRVKRVRSGGHEYLYFKTTRKNEAGKPIYNKLPPLNDPSFGAVYAAMMAGTQRKAKVVLTVSDLIDMYQRSPQWGKLADGSQRLYSIYLKVFREAFPTAPAGEVSRADVARLAASLSRTPSAANSLVRSIGSLYKWGRLYGHVINAPSKDIELNDDGEHEPWDEAILEAALACDDRRIKLAVSLLYYTGQRIGDVCAMRWSDIRNGVIEITQQKRKHEVTIPVHDSLNVILADTRKTGLTILAAGTGRRHTPDTVRGWLQKWVLDNHGAEIVPHGLRKNAVNALLECGCTVAEVSAITGQSLQVVEQYARKRNKRKLATSAILKWQNKGGMGK